MTNNPNNVLKEKVKSILTSILLGLGVIAIIGVLVSGILFDAGYIDGVSLADKIKESHIRINNLSCEETRKGIDDVTFASSYPDGLASEMDMAINHWENDCLK